MLKRWAWTFCGMLGCASSVQGTTGDDAGGATDSTPTGEAPRCDPSVLDDRGVVDAGAHPDAVYVVELAVSSQLHQCARMSDGTVRCRGRNELGELGLGTSGPSHADATPVPGLTDVAQVITTNVRTTCTRHLDGTVRCWGANWWGLLGTGQGPGDVCMTERLEGCRTRPTLVPGLTEVTHLAASNYEVCAVRRDGSVWCWGSTGFLLPQGGSATPVRVERLSDVSGLWYRSNTWIARLRSGRYIRATPIPTSPTPVDVPPEAEIAEGIHGHFLCYRLPDTSVRCIGYNPHGEIGNGTSSSQEWVTEPFNPGLCGVRSIVTGQYHSCALLADRTVFCWGDARNGGLGFAGQERCRGLNGPSDCVTRPTRVPGIDQVTRLFAGIWGTCALRADHSVWCWGALHPERRPTPQPVVW